MPEMPQSEIDALGGFRFLANQYGGSPQTVLKKISDLEEDNRAQREKIRVLTEAQPKETDAVVSKDRLKELEAYEAIGKPVDIKKLLADGETAVKELSELKLRESAAKFAKAVGLHEESVDTLTSIPALANATFETKKGRVKNKANVEVDGEVGYITLAGDGEKPLTFAELQERVTAVKGLRMAEVNSSTQSQGLSFVPQGGGGGDQSKIGNVFERIRAAHDPKPAAPATPAAPAQRSIEERLGMVQRS